MVHLLKAQPAVQHQLLVIQEELQRAETAVDQMQEFETETIMNIVRLTLSKIKGALDQWPSDANSVDLHLQGVNLARLQNCIETIVHGEPKDFVLNKIRTWQDRMQKVDMREVEGIVT